MSSFNLHSLFTTLTIICFINISKISQTSADGFSLNLIHRDSPLSPLYNPNDSHYDRLRKAIARSVIRAKRLSPNKAVSPTDDFQSEVRDDNGEYVMKYAIGSPPFDVFSVMDTGSDLTWMQCNPCTSCYQQNSPLFDPKSSSTYTDLTCQSAQCQQLRIYSCGAANLCYYSKKYQDLSYSFGNLAADTIIFNSTDERSLPFFNYTFGCGHSNGGKFQSDTSGVMGLGGGPLSLISQLKSAMSGKFSYCLVGLPQSHHTTTINFGSNAVVSGDGAVSTPLVVKEPPTFYYVTLNGISVGSTRIPYKSSSPNNVNADVDDGNIVVDSGTTITFLPPEFYDQLESTFDAIIRGTRAPSPMAPLKLCYYLKDGQALNIPHLTFHFDGADVPLFPANVFVRVADGVVCFTMAPAPAGVPNIFGNLAQVNCLVGYDVINMKITFKPTVCNLH